MSDGTMTFSEHLGELRNRLVRIAAYLFVAGTLGWSYHDPLFNFIAAPIRAGLAEHGVYTFTSIEIAETMFVYLKLSIVAGIFMALPLILFELWGFVAPGLYDKERQAIAPVVFFSTLFFLLGAYFAYEVVIPFMAGYLAELTLSTGGVEMDVTVKSAFDFALVFLLGFGVSFELPMLMFFLSTLGIMRVSTYIRFWRYFIVVSFIVAGILTPPDPFSQTMLALPLNLLYWVGVGGAWFAQRREGSGPLFNLRARAWGFLAVALLVLSVSIYQVIEWLGRSGSPFRFIPKDAAWVMSVRLDATGDRQESLAAALGIPADAGSRHVLLMQLATGERVAVLDDACKDDVNPDLTALVPGPTESRCERGDRVVAPAAAFDLLPDERDSLEKTPELAALNATGPVFIWHRSPPEGAAAVLPGAGDGVELQSLAAVFEPRGQTPWMELVIRPKAGAQAATLEARLDAWRRSREASAATPEKLAAVSRLALRSLELTERRLALLPGTGAVDRSALATLDAESRSIRAALTALEPGGPTAGTDLVSELGDGVSRLVSSIDDSTFRLRIELLAEKGLPRALSLTGRARALLDSAPEKQ